LAEALAAAQRRPFCLDRVGELDHVLAVSRPKLPGVPKWDDLTLAIPDGLRLFVDRETTDHSCLVHQGGRPHGRIERPAVIGHYYSYFALEQRGMLNLARDAAGHRYVVRDDEEWESGRVERELEMAEREKEERKKRRVTS